jgi:hypothetical protein
MTGTGRGTCWTRRRLGGDPGQASGKSHRALHSRRPRSIWTCSQATPRANTLTRRARRGGGVRVRRSRPGGHPCQSASSNRVPTARLSKVATVSTNQCRATRAGSVRRVRYQSQPKDLRARKLSSIQTRKPYQLTLICCGARSVSSSHGSSWSWAQTTSNVAANRLGRSL